MRTLSLSPFSIGLGKNRTIQSKVGTYLIPTHYSKNNTYMYIQFVYLTSNITFIHINSYLSITDVIQQCKRCFVFHFILLCCDQNFQIDHRLHCWARQCLAYLSVLFGPMFSCERTLCIEPASPLRSDEK